MPNTPYKPPTGFTLIELLVSMGVLALLLAITLIAINPAEQYEKSRDTKRRSDVSALTSAIQQYIADYKGALPGTIQAVAQPISSSEVDLCSNLVPDYIAALPQDPSSNNGVRIPQSSCSDYDTGYTVQFVGEYIRVDAPSAEGDEIIYSIL